MVLLCHKLHKPISVIKLISIKKRHCQIGPNHETCICIVSFINTIMSPLKPYMIDATLMKPKNVGYDIYREKDDWRGDGLGA